MDRPSLPHLALAVAVVGVAWSAILVRWSEAPSDVVAFYRVLFTLAIVAPASVLVYPGELRSISRRDGVIAIAAGVALAVHFLTWIESLDWTTVAASVTLVQLQPVFVAVGAALVLEERVDRRTVAGIAVAVAGTALLAAVQGDAGLPEGGVAWIGNVLALAGAVAAAGYVLVGRSLRQRVPVLPYVTVVYAACTAALFVAVAVDGAALLAAVGGHSRPAGSESIVRLAPFLGYPPREWILFLAMAVGPGLLGHTVVNWALEHVRSTLVSVSLLGEPIGATLLGVVLLGEVVPPAVAGAMAVVLGGIYLTATARPRDSAGSQPGEGEDIG